MNNSSETFFSKTHVDPLNSTPDSCNIQIGKCSAHMFHCELEGGNKLALEKIAI